VPAEGRPWWGFHELTDPWAYRLVNSAGIHPGELVLDVGAGRGAITAHLVKAGARVVAVELHPERARKLRRRFGSDIIVVEVDASDLRLPRGEFKVVANPPFGIATSLLRRLVSARSRLLTADLVVPSQTAARWTGGRGHRSTPRSMTYVATTVARLPPTAFRPPTPIATAVLRLERHGHGGADPNAPSTPSTILLASRCSAGTAVTGAVGRGIADHPTEPAVGVPPGRWSQRLTR
jgi:23S rRNA (adenine-N6)-dimethyltransferase